MKVTKKSLRKSRGQGMTEYIIIVALIAIAAIAVITLFGDNIRKLFGSSANALAGNTNATIKRDEASQSIQKRNLSNFADGNDTY